MSKIEELKAERTKKQEQRYKLAKGCCNQKKINELDKEIEELNNKIVLYENANN